MNRKPLLGIFLGLTLLGLGSGFWQTTQTDKLESAPAVSFKTIEGKTIELSALIGKPVLVTFWATDCKSCLEEIPDLINLHQQYSPTGLNIIAVAMAYDPPNHVLNTAKSRQLPYLVALDPDRSIALAFGNVQLTPTTYLIDRAGKVVMHHVGKFDLADMQRRIEQL